MSCASATVHVRSGINQPLLLLPAITESQTLLFFHEHFTCPALKEQPLGLCVDGASPREQWLGKGWELIHSRLAQTQGNAFLQHYPVSCLIEFSGTEGMAALGLAQPLPALALPKGPALCLQPHSVQSKIWAGKND